VVIDYMEVYTKVSKGGAWISKAREWMQSNVPRGDTLTWGSGEPVMIPFYKLEDFAREVAIAAIIEDRKDRDEVNTPQGWQRWDGTGDHPTGETKVHYRMRDGDVCDFDKARACDLDWAHTPKKLDWEIVAYKVVDDNE
jgi:hypothetical protein